MPYKLDGRAKFTAQQRKQLLSLFALDLDATAIASAMGCSRNTVNAHLLTFRKAIFAVSRQKSPLLQRMQPGDVFSQVGLVKGSARALRREPAALLGSLPHSGKIVVEVAPDREADALRCIRQSRFWMESFVKGAKCPLAWEKEMVVLDKSMLTARTSHYEGAMPSKETPPERMARFLQFAMVRLEKFRGLHAHMLALHLKETEFRFNHPGMGLYAALNETMEEHAKHQNSETPAGLSCLPFADK